MSEDARKAMLGRIADHCTGILALNESVDLLLRSADLADSRAVSATMRDVVRQKRVRILEMQGQLAALNVSFTNRFGTEP